MQAQEEPELPQDNQKEKNKKKELNSFAKYSALSFQMAAIILLGVFGGLKLDEWLELQFPIFTLILITIAIILAIYFAIKDFLK